MKLLLAMVFTVLLCWPAYGQNQDPHTEEWYTDLENVTRGTPGTSGIGNWYSLGHNQYDRFDGGTFFWNLEGTSRPAEGASFFAQTGVFKDWNDRVYTYTSLATSTNSQWYPKFRFDQDVNVKFGKKRNVVVTVGYTDISYHGPYRDQVLAAGLTLYLGHVSVQYRHSWNTSTPGNVPSQGDIFTLGLGSDRHSRLDLTYGTGAQAYLGNYLVLPQLIRQPTQTYQAHFRTWLTPSSGYFVTGQIVNVRGGYVMTGGQIGIFRDF